MIITYQQEQYQVIQKLFAPETSSPDELPIIHKFITTLEEYINYNGLCSDTEYPFTIIGKDSLNLTPLGINADTLTTFCKKIRENQEDLPTTLSNYLKVLKNTSLLESLNDTDATNTFFIICMYIQHPLHLKILITDDPAELLYDPNTPLDIITLIKDPYGIYYDLLNLEKQKEEGYAYSPEEDYTYWDL